MGLKARLKAVSHSKPTRSASISTLSVQSRSILHERLPSSSPVATASVRALNERARSDRSYRERAEQAVQLEHVRRSRTFTLRGPIGSHAIDDVEETEIGAQLLPQDRIVLEESVVVVTSVVCALEPVDRGVHVRLQRSDDGELDAQVGSLVPPIELLSREAIGFVDDRRRPGGLLLPA